MAGSNAIRRRITIAPRDSFSLRFRIAHGAGGIGGHAAPHRRRRAPRRRVGLEQGDHRVSGHRVGHGGVGLDVGGGEQRLRRPNSGASSVVS